MLEQNEEKELQEKEPKLDIFEEILVLDSEPDAENTCSNYTF